MVISRRTAPVSGLRRLVQLLFVVVSTQVHEVNAFRVTLPVASRQEATSSSRKNTALWDKEDDSEGFATPLALSSADWSRLKAMRQRHQVMPLLILPHVLMPKQALTFLTSDPNLKALYNYCMENDGESSKVAVVGLHPHTGRPLGRGVTIDFQATSAMVRQIPGGGLLMVAPATDERIALQGEPHLDDDTKSFYLAEVEVLNPTMEEEELDHEDDSWVSASSDTAMSPRQREHLVELTGQIPDLLEEWKTMVVKAGITNRSGLNGRLQSMGELPSNPADRAFWVAAALHPVPAFEHGEALMDGVDIRPAMLICTSDYDRTVLAVQGLQTSIEYLSSLTSD